MDNTLYQRILEQTRNALAEMRAKPKNALIDATRGGLLGATTDAVGHLPDAVADFMRPFGYNVPRDQVVGGSDWLANRLTQPTGSPAENSARFIAGMMTPSPMDFARLGRPPMQRITTYHGSPKDFDSFDMNAPKTTGGAFNKYGISVSRDKAVAQRYAKDFSESSGRVYSVDASVKNPLTLDPREFHSLQLRVGDFDEGKWSESKDIDIELLFRKYGIPFQSGEHPIEAIKKAGFDAIETGTGRGGSESEMLVFNDQSLKILSKE